MFVRASAFRSVKGFDAAFFAHMEEIDLCWRMQKAGNTVWYCPLSKVYHVGGGTLHKSNPHKTYLNFRNNLLMLYKNLPLKDFEKVFSVRKSLDLLAAVGFVATSGSFSDAFAVKRAYADFRKMKNERSRLNEENESAKEKIREVFYPESILKAYYFGGKKTFSRLGF